MDSGKGVTGTLSVDCRSCHGAPEVSFCRAAVRIRSCQSIDALGRAHSPDPCSFDWQITFQAKPALREAASLQHALQDDRQ